MAAVCLIALGGLCMLIAIKTIPVNSVIHVSWVGAILLGLLTALSFNNQTITSLLQLIAHLGLAIILSRHPPRLSTQITLCSIIIIFFFLKIISSTNPEDVFTVSRNYISVIVVLSACLYYIACEEENKKPSILIAVTFMAITMWAIGRAGMASAAILLVGALIYKASGRVIAMTLIVGALVVLSQLSSSTTLLYDDDSPLSVFLVGVERIERLGGGGQRDLINSEYFLRLQNHPAEIVFGAPLEKIQSIAEVDGNPHNSYIRLHAMTGIFGVGILFGALLAAYIRLIRKKKYLTLLAITTCLFRSTFDSAAFHGPLDIIIFYGIFRAFTETKFVFKKGKSKNYDHSENARAIAQKLYSPSNLNIHLNR